MSNENKTLIRKYKETEEENSYQKDLRQKHNIENEDVYIVEKSNIFKFILRVIYYIFRIVLSVAFIALAAIGLICLIYPETRNAYESVWNSIVNNLFQLIGGG